MMYRSVKKVHAVPLQFTIALLMFCCMTGLSQDKNLVQIKTFDQQLKPITNIGVSINGNEFITIEKASSFHEISKADLPPKFIKINNDELEAESWNYSKGVLEIIIRKRNYVVQTVMLRTIDNKPVADVSVRFIGKKSITVKSDAQGNAQVPLGFNESMIISQFTVVGYSTKKLTTNGNEKILVVDPIQKKKEESKPIDVKVPVAFDLSQLDSIRSLTVFYAVFKNYEIAGLDDATKKKIDAKFYQLVNQLDAHRENKIIGRISDSSFVKSDVKNLLEQAQLENNILDNLKTEFDDKIKIINEKLSDGTANLTPVERNQLLSDLNMLEGVLMQNENKFYKNLSSYRMILSSLKSSFFDVQKLEDKLEHSEGQRKEEQKQFRQKIFIVVSIAVAFGILVIFLILLRMRLTRQRAELVRVNSEIKSINENLESLVFERTRLLKNAHHEMDVFLYRASHDLRSPICSILGLSNIALHSEGDELMELIQRVSVTAKRMDRMLNKLRIISEVNQPSNYSQLNLFSVIQNVLHEFTYYIDNHNIEIQIECERTISFYSYPDLLQTILRNLIDNAIFFSTVESKRTALVQIKARIENNKLSLSIYDNGIGIEDNVITKLWDMFFVGNAYSKGNGLGLYVVAKAVYALKGTIDVQTKVDAYTIFTTSIPVNTKATASLLQETTLLELATH